MIKCEVDEKTKRMNIQAEGSTAQLLTELTKIMEVIYKNLNEQEQRTFKENYNGVLCPFSDKKEEIKKGIMKLLNEIFDMKAENDDCESDDCESDDCENDDCENDEKPKIEMHAIKIEKDSEIGRMIENLIKKMESDDDDE